METLTSYINNHWPFQIKLCFAPLIDMLEKNMSTPLHTINVAHADILTQIVESYELRYGIPTKTYIEENAELIHTLLDTLFPAELSNSEIKAACIPFTDIIFNHTNLFKKLLDTAEPGFKMNIKDQDAHHSYVACCCLILNKYYHANLDLRKPLFYEIPISNGITKYYRVLYNTHFITVQPTDLAVEFTKQDIDLLINNYDDLELWKRMFPEGSWLLKGFAIMTLIDVTIENAVSIFKEKLLALKTDNFKVSVTSIFRSIFILPKIEVGFTLFDEDTCRLRPAVFNHQNLSFLLPGTLHTAAKRVLCENSYNHLIVEHKNFVVSDVSRYYEESPGHLGQVFLEHGIHSFVLAPVVKEGKLLGILEVISHEAGALHSLKAQILEIVMPFLSDAIQRLITRYQLQVEAVIQEYYTSIHPSVKWKFFHESEKFLYYQELEENHTISDIILQNVYPLYGQIDIKGSSRQRNECVQKDLIEQLKSAVDLLNTINFLQDKIPILESMLTRLQSSFQADIEEAIAGYLKNIHRQLANLIDNTENKHAQQAQSYLNECDKKKGNFHKHRRSYEQTVKLINENLAKALTNEQLTAQKIIPHYFEHYKTDGVEHILYAGNSISPHLHFTVEKLYELRFWQISVLCKMEKVFQHLKPNLGYPLEVTSLILVYNNSLTLRFRVDEKRFDVDGTYNVRFEMLKKRIDKAKIKNSDQRITEPGKLTVVYAGAQEELEYIGYFKQLQLLGLVQNDHEIVEVEDLQDVSGLKALRASFK